MISAFYTRALTKTPEQWSKVEIYCAALQQAQAEERAARLAAITDGEVRKEVASLLQRNGLQRSGEALTLTDVQGAGVAAAESPSAPSRTAFPAERIGPYRILRRIGQGGMGEVFEAVRVDDFQKQVAIKIVRREFDSDFARARFQRERQVLAALEHPNIARLLDGGALPDGSPYLVMEYVEGQPVTEYCRRNGHSERRRATEVLAIFIEICGAVEYAHQKGVVHRDIKPANILVTPDGIPKLLDFGIARSEKWMQLGAALTGTGFLIGSISYMSPEQARGMQVDSRSDIFSLGVVLYELICKKRPFEAETASDVLAAIISREPAPRAGAAAEISPALANLLERALRKQADERFTSVREMLDSLKQILRTLESGAASGHTDTLLRIELFGNLRLTYAGQPVTSVNTNRLQSLLAFLVLHGDSVQSREHLAFLLWPGSSESQARTNLRQLLHHLRRSLPEECCLLASDNHTVQWRRDPSCAIDALEFAAALSHAQKAAKRADTSAELSALEEAVRLHQEDLLRELYDEWVQPKREEYRRQAAQALTRLVSIYETQRNYAAAIPHAERLVNQDPLRESHHQLLIRLHMANSDRASALRAYHQCMRTLRRELGVQPGAATRELFEQALKSESVHASPVELSPPSAGPLPLIGRQKEWEQLTSCWRAVENGASLLALIAGEPGIGKSRLAEELFHSCSAKGAAVARGRCYAAQGQLAYAPVAEWLRAQPLRAASSQLAPAQLTELARVLPEILTEYAEISKPAPLTQSWERRYFFDSLNAAFEKCRKPLLLVIDDLQWCDHESLEWLPSLFNAEESAAVSHGGILVLGTVRPEETDRTHPLTRIRSELQRIGKTIDLPLARLSVDDTAALAAKIGKHAIDDAELSELYRTTQGNPLFVVETVRAGSADLSAAPKVHAVIAARFARLSSSAYELAGLAGAIGRAFSFDLLAKATDWDEDSLSRALEELWQRRVIETKPDASGEYDFTHDRLREVAYSELNPVRRRYLHRRIAKALEELHAPDIQSVAGQIAAHSQAAGMAEQAIRYYRVAATVASQRFADAEAADLLRKALALCRDLPASARQQELELELLVQLERSMFTILGYASPQVGQVCADALALFRRIGAKQHGLAVLSSNWVFHIVRADHDTARRLGEELLELGASERNDACLMAGHFVVGSSRFHLGEFAEARKQLEESLAILPRCVESDLKLFAIVDVGLFCKAYLPHSLWHLGFPDTADSRTEEALAEARQSHPFSLAIVLNYAALLHALTQDSRRASLYAEEAAALCHRYDFAYYSSMAEIVAGWAQAMQGDAQSGLRRIRQGLDALKGTGGEVRVPFYHGLIAEACAQAGQTGEALANISSGFAFQNKNHETWAAPHLYRIEGDLLMDSGRTVEALASYQRAVAAARQSGARMLELQALIRMCRQSDSHRNALEALYLQFTEGFSTADLRLSKTLLKL